MGRSQAEFFFQNVTLVSVSVIVDWDFNDDDMRFRYI